MTDEPISALTLFTSYSTADEVEILDVSDTTFASTGTNKRIPFSTLLTMAGVATAANVTTVAGGGTGLTAVGSADQLLGVAHTGGALEYKTLTAGSNVTITPAAGSITIASTGGGGGGGMSNPMTTAGDTIYGGASGTPGRLAIGTTGQVLTVNSGATAPTWATPVLVPGSSNNYISAVLSSTTSIGTGTSFSNIGLSITLPAAGTYLLFGTIRSFFAITGSIGQFGFIAAELYDVTNSKVISGSAGLPNFGALQVASTSIGFQGAAPIGPVFYTPSITPATIQLWTLYSTTASLGSPAPEVLSDGNGNTVLCAIRVA